LLVSTKPQALTSKYYSAFIVFPIAEPFLASGLGFRRFLIGTSQDNKIISLKETIHAIFYFF